MVWTVKYHPAVKRDLLSMGRVEAAAILKVIETRILR